MNEETFGPIIPVMRVGDDEEAIRYALHRSIFLVLFQNLSRKTYLGNDALLFMNAVSSTQASCLEQAMLTPKD